MAASAFLISGSRCHCQGCVQGLVAWACGGNERRNTDTHGNDKPAAKNALPRTPNNPRPDLDTTAAGLEVEEYYGLQQGCLPRIARDRAVTCH